MSLPGEPQRRDSDDEARAVPRLRSVRSVPGVGQPSGDEAAPGSVRTEAVWHGGGTRDAYEALLRLLFSPEPERVEGACE